MFTSPRIASVGITEQAKAPGRPYVTATRDYSGIAYGWAMEDGLSSPGVRRSRHAPLDRKRFEIRWAASRAAAS